MSAGASVQVAVRGLEVARARVAEMVAEKASLEARAGECDRRAVDLVMDDPEGAEQAADETDRARRRAAMISAGIKAGRGRVEELRSVALREQAAALQPEAEAAREALRVFDERTEELRTALTAHTLQFWTADKLAVGSGDQVVALAGGVSVETFVPARNALIEGLDRVVKTIAALEASAAAGPVSLVTQSLGPLTMPECLRPGGWADPALDYVED